MEKLEYTYWKETDGMYLGYINKYPDNWTQGVDLEDLKNGRFKLLEINGAKSEPLHIYDPNLSLSQVVNDISLHWKTLFGVVKENIATTEFPSSMEGRSIYL